MENKEEKENEKKSEVNEIEKENLPLVTEELPAEKVIETVKEVPLEKKVTWSPKTALGKEVVEGKIKNVEEILLVGKKIIEPEIVDQLVPDLQSELIYIGGSTGKGGGIQRIPIRITAKMHRSGRRFKTSSLIVVGNNNGLVGVGIGSGVEARGAMEKALKKAKLNIIKIKRGCGDWECSCSTEHSIPFRTKGKSGSVRVELIPAPKGVGLVVDKESKKILKLAGIKDVWIKTFGNTSNRTNLILAIFDALKNLYVYEKG